jgi:hypothetical protein
MRAAPEGVAMGQDPTEKSSASKRRFYDAPEDHFSEDERDIERVESAWAKAALYFRTGWHFGHKRGSIRCQSMIRIHEGIEVFRRRFERGDTLALLHAVNVCAEENLPLPSWLAAAYESAFQSFLMPGGPTSLDAVFHSPKFSKGTPKRRASVRQDWQLGSQLWDEAWQLVINDEAIQSLDAVLDVLFSKKNYGVQKTKARKLILMVENNQCEHLGKPPSKHLSQVLEKRRKR